jgi:hypothetical protein
MKTVGGLTRVSLTVSDNAGEFSWDVPVSAHIWLIRWLVSGLL